MVSIYKNDNIKLTEEGEVVSVELRGLSTDEKPTTLGEDKLIANGSVFIEMDTQKIFFFDAENEEWKGE
jgi:hypothetical protein